MTTSILGASDSHTFTAFTNTIAVSSVAFGADNCGGQTYSLKMQDGTTNVPDYLSLSGFDVTLSTTNTAYIGTHTVRLIVKLDAPYNLVTHYEEFQVVINECAVTIDTQPTISN